MTDEKLAEEWADKNITLAVSIYNPQAESIAKQAFLAGLKADRTKWHKVTDGDLPKEPEFLKSHPDNHRYEWFLVATVGRPDKALYSFAKKKWFIDYEEMMLGDSYFKPIAWCEIPQYTEE